MKITEQHPALTHSGTTAACGVNTRVESVGFTDAKIGQDHYVDVESVRFTDNTIGISGDTDMHPADKHREPGTLA